MCCWVAWKLHLSCSGTAVFVETYELFCTETGSHPLFTPQYRVNTILVHLITELWAVYSADWPLVTLQKYTRVLI